MPTSFASFLREIAPESRPELARALRRHAVRQVATLKASGAALAHAPTLDDRVGAVERAKEELEHLEQASEAYRELAGKDLLSAAEEVAARLPVPASWAEASVAQLVLCLAARVDLDHYRATESPMHVLTKRALAAEVEHVNAAREALRELFASEQVTSEQTSEYVERWLPVALGSLEAEETRSVYMHALERETRALTRDR